MLEVKMLTLKQLYNELREERGRIKADTLIDASVDFTGQDKDSLDDKFSPSWKVSYLMRPCVLTTAINHERVINFWMTSDHPDYKDPGCVEHILDLEFNKEYDNYVLYINAYNKLSAQYEYVPVQEMRIENGPHGKDVVHLVAYY